MSLRKTDIFRRLAAALDGPDVVPALVAIARTMRDEGSTQAEVEALFRELLKRCVTAGDENREDAVRDALDYVVGWCVPPASVFDEGD